MGKRALIFLAMLLCACVQADDAKYRKLIALPEVGRLVSTLSFLSGRPTRLAGSAGERATLDYAEREFRRLGMAVSREPMRVTIPDPLSRGELSVGGRNVQVPPLWPNMVTTSTCDVHGPIVYGGDGSAEALSGKQLKGAIVLLEFDSGPNWTQAAAHGAAAIVFLQPKHMRRQEAEFKFSSIPLHVPRFLLSIKDAGPALNAAATGESVRLTCRQDWIASESANLIGDMPGSDPALAGEPIVLWAYADAMSITPGKAPGVMQGSGFAALLEIASVFKSTPHRRPIRFVVSGAHGLNLLGAREFIERHLEDSRGVPLLVASLDLSTDSRALGVFGRGYGYNYRDEVLEPILSLGRKLRQHAEHLAPIYAEASPRLVLTDAINHSDNRTWRNNIPARFTFDCEPFLTAGYNSVTFATIDDERSQFDTTDDTSARPENLLRQVQTLTVLVDHLLNDPLSPTGDDTVPLQVPTPRRLSLVGGFGTASGYVALYNPARSLVPDERVKGSLAVRFSGYQTLMGVRADEVQLAQGDHAEFKFLGLPLSSDYATVTKPKQVVVACHLDPVTGTVDYAPDEGAFGVSAYPTVFELKTASRSSPIVVFHCTSTTFFDLVDPQDLSILVGAEVLDPIGGAPPKSFGLALPFFDPASWSGGRPAAVLFIPPEQRFQLVMTSILGEKRLLLTGSTPKNEAGDGYMPVANFGSVTIPTARDICNINQARIDRFTKYRILTGAVLETHRQALDELRQAEAAEAKADWAGAERHGRAAWGLALRAHPVLQKTASDIVNGVILYSFLLIPFSLFLERLLFASRSLTTQLLATVGIFIASFIALRFIHPAFEIVANPAMIFVGFIMGALSLIVIAFIIGKFELALREVRQAQTGVRDIDVKRANVAMAAFSLGISNLRRRKIRTFLTVLTLVVMTFIVLSFTSVVPDLKITETPSSNPARYSGLLLRNPGLEPLDGSSYQALLNEFGGEAKVVRRVYAYGADILEGAAMSLQHGDNWADASALEGFDPGESEVTRPQEALVAGRWFEPGERDTIILPSTIAQALRVTPEDVGKATVRFMGADFKVVGIFDPGLMRAMTDLDGDSIIPPDFSLSKKLQSESHSQTRAFRQFIRLDPSVCILVPAQRALDLRGNLRTVSVAFPQPEQTRQAMNALMPRLRLNLYGSVAGPSGLEVRQFSILQGTKTGGLVLILVQLVIAAVFVLNTMIASVYERTREIAIFSAIGLAPNHISGLFFAESLVYGVLGTVFGYFIAQGTAKVLVATGAYPQLTLNFSSSSAMMSILLVMGVVLLSTIYPARKAAQIAAPAQAEQALATEPEGDTWTLPLPFSISSAEAGPLIGFLADWLKRYEEYTIGEFVTSGTSTSNSGAKRRVSATAWLAPYDLGVSQELVIEARPSAIAGVNVVDLTLTRLAGEVENWTTVNRRFLDSLRRQFLRWRTLSEEERAGFSQRSEIG